MKTFKVTVRKYAMAHYDDVITLQANSLSEAMDLAETDMSVVQYVQAGSLELNNSDIEGSEVLGVEVIK